MNKTLVSALLLSLVALMPSSMGQDDGQEYGALCNGVLLQCNRHSNTVVCLQRVVNSTNGIEECSTGIGVDLGRCQCSRNCGADGVYNENGEFDSARSLCVGFVDQLCTGLVPHCTQGAVCNFLTSKCVCDVGFMPDPQGKRCIPA